MDFSQRSLIEGSWSNRRALSLVAAAEASYIISDDLRFVVEDDWGLNLIERMPLGASQGFIAEGDDLVLVAFSGTNQLSDWIANMKIGKRTLDWGIAHRGFHDAYRAVAADVRIAGATARQKDKTLWITGHSLGGALAHIATHDLLPQGNRMGLCTFGQPRTVKVNTAQQAEPRLALGYHRIVNERDIVARIPPGFHHTGTLIQLGSARRWFGAESEGLDTEPEPLNHPEFDVLQSRIQNVRDGAAESLPGDGDHLTPGQEQAVDRTVEGLIPGIRDHKITSYRAAIRSLAGDTDEEAEGFLDLATSFSPNTPVARPELGGASDPLISGDLFGDAPAGASRATRSAAEAADPAPTTENSPVPVLLRLAVPDWTPPGGVRVLSRMGDFATVLATAQEVESLRRDDNIRSLEVSREGGIAELSEALPFVRGRPVDRADQAERGDAALVGVIDTGIDILHDAFTAPDGSTRIIAIWDQRDQTGPTPHAVDPAFGQMIGTLHVAADIDRLRKTPGNVPNWLRDPGAHGTHVAGIAAGRATGNLPDGVAPQAGIVVVIPDMETTSGNPASLGYSVSHVNALAFLKALAAGGNTLVPSVKPIAINVSLGMNAGAHDGTTLLEAAFDTATAQGRDRGMVIIKSAGNERPHRGHAHISTAIGRVDLDWTSSVMPRRQDYFEAWYKRFDDLEFVLQTPDGSRSDPVSSKARRFGGSLQDNRVDMRLRVNHPDNGDNVLQMSIRAENAEIQPEVWTLEVRGKRIGAETVGLNIWVERMNARAVQFDNADQSMTLSIPGTANHIITVGATDINAEYAGVIRASSFGPTRDGRAKPELSAPGREIMSAYANTSDPGASTAMTGTSMAAPFVTGAVALALSQRAKDGRRQFNNAQISTCLVQSVQSQSTLHHTGFGYGVLDIAAFLENCDQTDD